jgi:hypothetical protein
MAPFEEGSWRVATEGLYARENNPPSTPWLSPLTLKGATRSENSWRKPIHDALASIRF